ncbi:MAG: hypothetical protein V2A76_13730 [Planctomycetota bacterium]
MKLVIPSLPEHPTHAVNLAELSIFSWQDLERASRGSLAVAVAGEQEFRCMVAWRAQRLGREAADPPSATPSGVAFPVAAGGRESRCGVGWADAIPVSEAVAGGSSIDPDVLVGFDLARRWLSFRSIGAGGLAAHVMAPSDVEGGSAGLASLIACLARSIGLEIPGDLAATGCLAIDGNEVRILPVHEETIAGKVEALRRHGYRRIMIPSGQQSQFDAQMRAGDDIVLIPLAETVSEALPVILGVLVEGVSATQPLMKTLLLLDRVCVRSPHGVDRGFPRNLVRAIRRGGEPILRILAADLGARWATHVGRPGAARLDAYVERVMESQSIPIGDPWLAEYFDSHQLAARAIRALDAGDWNLGRKSRAWDELDAEIEELSRRHERRSRRFINVRDRFALFVCLNTRAFLKLFRGRLERDQGLVLEGLEDRVALFGEWDELVRYGTDLGHADCTLGRQQNYVIDALASASELGALPPGAFQVMSRLQETLPAEPALSEDLESRDTFFRVSSLWKWSRLPGNARRDQAFADWLLVVRAAKLRLDFPRHLPIELLAVFHPDPAVREDAAELLESQPWFSEGEDPRSILWVLRLRTEAAVLLARGESGQSEKLVELVNAAPDGPLREIGERVIAEGVEEVMLRCPY